LEELLAGADESDIEAAQLQVEQARLSLEQARLQLEQSTLVAPMAGTVTALNVETGEMASAGQAAVVVVSDLSTLTVDVNLDETDVAQVELGQEVLVSVDAFPEAELSGEVTYIASVAETQSGVVLYPVTVQLAPTEVSVRAGMTADVEVIAASREDALIVPLRAVHTEGERAYVYRVVDGQTERVEVGLGLTTDTEVEIISSADGASVAEGDVVSVVAAPTQGSTERGFGPGGVFGGGED
jgi:HlyD family secretion protein